MASLQAAVGSLRIRSVRLAFLVRSSPRSSVRPLDLPRLVLVRGQGLARDQFAREGQVLGEKANEKVSAPAADSRLVEIVCFERRWKRR